MTYECLVELFEVVDGLVGEQVEPYLGEAPKADREHATLSDVSSSIKI